VGIEVADLAVVVDAAADAEAVELPELRKVPQVL
jgi:hypothetical protein